jgi:hypothetical protein
VIREYVWVFVNFGIAGGYYVLALSLYKLLQQFMRINWQIRLGAFLFFAMCSWTHVENALHVAIYPSETNKASLLASHSYYPHVVQFVGVWLFIFGVLSSLRLGRGIDRATAEHLKAAIEARVEEEKT